MGQHLNPSPGTRYYMFFGKRIKNVRTQMSVMHFHSNIILKENI